MNLNLFEDKEVKNGLLSKFIEELRKALNHEESAARNEPESNRDLEEYQIYEKKKIFLDNQSRRGNDFAWVIDNNSICVSEHGDGGSKAISEIDLPENIKAGEVYEKIDGKYCYNEKITMELSKVGK